MNLIRAKQFARDMWSSKRSLATAALLAALSLSGNLISATADNKSKKKDQPVSCKFPSSKQIFYPQESTIMPDGPGRQQFMQSCTVCHTALYVTMQPRFERKVWQAEVKKMVKIFGAHVPASDVPKIVDYLVAINGRENAAVASKGAKPLEDNSAN